MDEIFHPPPSSKNTPVSKPSFKRVMVNQPLITTSCWCLGKPLERVVFFSTRKMNESQSLENMGHLTLGKICPRCAKHGFRLLVSPLMATHKSPLLSFIGIETKKPGCFEFWVAKLFSLTIVVDGLETKKFDSCNTFRQDCFSFSSWFSSQKKTQENLSIFAAGAQKKSHKNARHASAPITHWLLRDPVEGFAILIFF